MNSIKFSAAIIALSLTMYTCTEEEPTIELEEVVSETFSNLHAPQQGGQGEPISGAFTKFDFATQDTTSDANDWDIAFRGTTIIVNGGTSQGTTDEPERTGNAAAYIVDNTFGEVQNIEEDLFVQDSPEGLAIPSGSGEGWYNYNSSTFTVTPIAGKVIVIRTRDGKYAKVEILSYYKDAPAEPNAFTDESRYYTFIFSYQPNEGVTQF